VARPATRIEGLKELQETMRDLSKATQGNVLKRSVSIPLAEFAQEASDDAPYEEGDLSENIQVGKPKIVTPGTSAFARAMQETGDRAQAIAAARAANRAAGGEGKAVVASAGPTKLVGQGVLQEFGTAHHPPQPFMRPTWDRLGPMMPMKVAAVLKEQLDKAVARAQRKAARIAAKMKR